jgi:hypothetical protein
MPSTYTLISSNVLSSTASSVTFSSIPSTFTDLVLRISARTNRANVSDSLGYYYNSDTTAANYPATVILGEGSGTPTSSRANSVNDETAFINGNTSTASTFGNTEIYIPNYALTITKPSSNFSVAETNATTVRMNAAAVLYTPTTAISSITITPISGTLFLSTSSFYLYGIKNS